MTSDDVSHGIKYDARDVEKTRMLSITKKNN